MMDIIRTCLILLMASVFFLSCEPSFTNAVNIETLIAHSSIGSNPIDQDVKERKYTLMEREIEYLMTIWPGGYDNVEQLSFEKDAGRHSKELGQHKRIHSKATRVYNKFLGEYLLYVEEFQHNDTTDIYRQQIYELIAEDSNAQIRIRRYSIKKAKVLWRSPSIVERIKSMNKSEFELSETCDIILQREGKEFIGKTEHPACSSSRNEGLMEYQIKISKNNYGFRTLKMDRDTILTTPLSKREDWYLLDRARCFVCMIDFPREPGGRPVNTKYYVDIHDQGGQFDFDYDDGRHMVFTMRNTWSYGMQRNTFVIVIQEGSLDGKTLIYSWGSDGADRIGMNPGWIRIQCDLKTEKNIQLQQGLRPDS